jgi:hypothetical protein
MAYSYQINEHFKSYTPFSLIIAANFIFHRVSMIINYRGSFCMAVFFSLSFFWGKYTP